MCLMLLRILGVMDTKLVEYIIILEGTAEFRTPQSCCHSNYVYLNQRLISIVCWFSWLRHLFLARSKTGHILAGLGPSYSVSAKQRIYPRELSFELWQCLQNAWQRHSLDPLQKQKDEILDSACVPHPGFKPGTQKMRYPPALIRLSLE